MAIIEIAPPGDGVPCGPLPPLRFPGEREGVQVELLEPDPPRLAPKALELCRRLAPRCLPPGHRLP